MQLNTFTFGSFLKHSTWWEAKKLLDFQIAQKATNKHYNKLSFYHFEGAMKCYTGIQDENYFNERIKTSFFYALQSEYYAIPYSIPKKGIGVRSQFFFSYPMMTLYYAVGLYFVKLTEQLLGSKKSANIDAFYGANLTYQNSELVISKKTTYYKSYYEDFKRKLNAYAEAEENRFVIRLDIQNYFESICITTLLTQLEYAVKHSVKQELGFNEHTKEQLEFFFRFIKHGKGGIPQSENNLASSYIGFLYLFFGDSIIEECIKQIAPTTHINHYRIIRYVDDIYIVLDFSSNLNSHDKESIIYHLLNSITHCLNEKLKLNINSKTKIFRPHDVVQLMDFVHAIGSISEENESQASPALPVGYNLSIPEKTDRLLNSLAALKLQHLNHNPDNSYKSLSFDDLKDVFDRGVQNLLQKKENKEKLSFILNEFNFELCRLQPHALICIILTQEQVAKNLLDYLRKLEVRTIYDINFIMTYLCQTEFKDKILKKNLKKNETMKRILKKFKDNVPNTIPCTGYYKLPYSKISWIMNQTTLLEQIKLRIHNERTDSYSISLNLLLNELQLICWLQEKSTTEIKHYDAKAVENFLDSKGIGNEIKIAITNLFDRRNNNGISHPGSIYHMPVAVSRKEYKRHQAGVHLALQQILQDN